MSELLKINLIFDPPCTLCSQIRGTEVTFKGQGTAITFCTSYHSLTCDVSTTKTAQRTQLHPLDVMTPLTVIKIIEIII